MKKDWAREMFDYAWDLRRNGLEPDAIERKVIQEYSDDFLDHQPAVERPLITFALRRVFGGIRFDFTLHQLALLDLSPADTLDLTIHHLGFMDFIRDRLASRDITAVRGLVGRSERELLEIFNFQEYWLDEV